MPLKRGVIFLSVSIFSVLYLPKKIFQNNFSTLKTVENVEKFLSKKCDFGSFSLGRQWFVHKFSTLSTPRVLKTHFEEKIYFSAFCPKRLHFSFFEAFFDILISALYFFDFLFVKITTFGRKSYFLRAAPFFEGAFFAPFTPRASPFAAFLAFALKLPFFPGFAKVFEPFCDGFLRPAGLYSVRTP